VQLLRDEGILRPHAEADEDDDVEEAEGWGSEEEGAQGERRFQHVLRRVSCTRTRMVYLSRERL
jgi:hypothetical protein